MSDDNAFTMVEFLGAASPDFLTWDPSQLRDWVVRVAGEHETILLGGRTHLCRDDHKPRCLKIRQGRVWPALYSDIAGSGRYRGNAHKMCNTCLRDADLVYVHAGVQVMTEMFAVRNLLIWDGTPAGVGVGGRGGELIRNLAAPVRKLCAKTAAASFNADDADIVAGAAGAAIRLAQGDSVEGANTTLLNAIRDAVVVAEAGRIAGDVEHLATVISDQTQRNYRTISGNRGKAFNAAVAAAKVWESSINSDYAATTLRNRWSLSDITQLAGLPTELSEGDDLLAAVQSAYRQRTDCLIDETLARFERAVEVLAGIGSESTVVLHVKDRTEFEQALGPAPLSVWPTSIGVRGRIEWRGPMIVAALARSTAPAAVSAGVASGPDADVTAWGLWDPQSDGELSALACAISVAKHLHPG